jgi:protein required for attachment to host cells
MRLSLPLLSLLLLACGLADARPATFGKRSQNATLAEIIAKRQTNRQNIALRAHVKDTIKRVQSGIKEKEARGVSLDLATRTTTQVELKEERALKADGKRLLLPRASGDTITRKKRDLSESGSTKADKRALTADGKRLLLPRASGDTVTRKKRGLSESESTKTEKRALTADGKRLLLPRASGDAAPTQRKRRSTDPTNEVFEERGAFEILEEQQVALAEEIVYEGAYPRCPASIGRKTGYAHYAGWKLGGDDVSGPLHLPTVTACPR